MKGFDYSGGARRLRQILVVMAFASLDYRDNEKSR